MNQELIVIEDIPSEAKKSASETRWVDIRPNQKEQYKSMICVPIVEGKRSTPARKILAILVIDTDRERYFLENQYYRAFLGRILSPFRTILTLALEFEKVPL